jgi:hypothetical protein
VEGVDSSASEGRMALQVENKGAVWARQVLLPKDPQNVEIYCCCAAESISVLSIVFLFSAIIFFRSDRRIFMNHP